jgi:hypothetical protein
MLRDQSEQKESEIQSQSIAEHGSAHLSCKLYWEAEIRRIMVPGQFGQKSLQDPSPQKKAGHGSTCLISQLTLGSKK